MSLKQLFQSLRLKLRRAESVPVNISCAEIRQGREKLVALKLDEAIRRMEREMMYRNRLP